MFRQSNYAGGIASDTPVEIGPADPLALGLYLRFNKPMNTTTAATVLTATSLYGKVLQVTVNDDGQVRTVSGAFLGDVDGMTQVGWEIA